MKLFAFDKCKHNSMERQMGKCTIDTCTEYSKKWETLSKGITVKISGLNEEWKELQKESEAWLLLVHQSCEWTHSPKPKKGFVLYVSGGASGCAGNDDPACPHVHYSRRVVPTGSDLGYLKELFSKLCTTLADAGTDIDKIKRAWEEWESPVLSRLITAMAPLALKPKNETLANSIANSILKELRHASDELSKEVEEDELRKWLIKPDATAAEMMEWMQRYPHALHNLSRRYL